MALFLRMTLGLSAIFFFTQVAAAAEPDTCLYSFMNSKGSKCKSNFVFAVTLLQKNSEGSEVSGVKTKIEVLDNDFYPIANTNFFLTDYSNTFPLDTTGQGIIALGTGYEAIQFKVAGKEYRAKLDHLKAASQFPLEFLPRKRAGSILQCTGAVTVVSPGQVGALTIGCR